MDGREINRTKIPKMRNTKVEEEGKPRKSNSNSCNLEWRRCVIRRRWPSIIEPWLQCTAINMYSRRYSNGMRILKRPESHTGNATKEIREEIEDKKRNVYYPITFYYLSMYLFITNSSFPYSSLSYLLRYPSLPSQTLEPQKP